MTTKKTKTTATATTTATADPFGDDNKKGKCDYDNGGCGLRTRG
jgi:hypothetical protein